MSPVVQTVFEHERVGVSESGEGGTFATREVAHLARLGETCPGFCTLGHRSVRLAQFCGVVGLGGRALEVLPKTESSDPPNDAEACRGVLLRLLAASPGLRHLQQLPVGQHFRRAPLLEVFIAAFLDSVASIARGGLLKQYRETQEDLDAVRGRIAIGRQVTVLANRPDRIACTFDDLTVDNAWNRVVKCGVRAVRPWIRSIDLGRRWLELLALFEEVADITTEQALREHLAFDRQGRRYRIAIDWARWILELISPTIRAGKNEAPALLFDMNRLFEAALSTVIRRRAAAAPQIEVRTQDRRHHLADTGTSATPERRAYQLRPDIVISQGHKALAIGDTKWKLLETDAHGRMVPDRSDMYQMHAYAAAYRCTDLALLYPWHAGLKDSVETRFDLPAIGEVRPRVHVLCVDVGQDGFPLIRGRSGGRIGELMAASE